MLCMQALSLKLGNHFLWTIDRVAGHGMSKKRHVHTNLVRTACLKPQSYMCKPRITRDHLIMRHSGT